MRKFNSPVNLKAAADSFVSEAFIDVTARPFEDDAMPARGNP